MSQPKPTEQPHVKKFFAVYEIIEQLKPCFTTINGKLAEAINHELIKISIVNIRRTPKYIPAARSKNQVNKFRETAIERFENRLKSDSNYLAEFRIK